MKKYAYVKFDENPFKSYQFLTDIEDLQAGDTVVVDTKNGLVVAKFESYNEVKKSGLASLKWIVQKVDLDSHKKRLEDERELIALKNKMESRRKELEEIQIFALLAKEDPSMKDLYEKFMTLSNH